MKTEIINNGTQKYARIIFNEDLIICVLYDERNDLIKIVKEVDEKKNKEIRKMITKKFEKDQIVNGNGKGTINAWMRFKVIEQKKGGWVTCSDLKGKKIFKFRSNELNLLK